MKMTYGEKVVPVVIRSSMWIVWMIFTWWQRAGQWAETREKESTPFKIYIDQHKKDEINFESYDWSMNTIQG